MTLGSKVVVALCALVALLSLTYAASTVLGYGGAEVHGSVAGHRSLHLADEGVAPVVREEVLGLLGAISAFVDGELRTAREAGEIDRTADGLDPRFALLCVLESRMRAIVRECSRAGVASGEGSAERQQWLFTSLPEKLGVVIGLMEGCAKDAALGAAWESAVEDLRARRVWFEGREG
jgi:hypothetical protein